jgi:hypothetical protein
MASIVVPTPIVLTLAQSYSSEEWEQKRSIRTQLYHDKAKAYSLRSMLFVQRRSVSVQTGAIALVSLLMLFLFQKWAEGQ